MTTLEYNINPTVMQPNNPIKYSSGRHLLVHLLGIFFSSFFTLTVYLIIYYLIMWSYCGQTGLMTFKEDTQLYEFFFHD